MVNGYDGSIRINTLIETKGVNSQMMKIVSQIKKAEAEVSRLTARMKELENEKISASGYEKLQKDIEKTSALLERLNAKKAAMESQSIPIKEYSSLQKELDSTIQKYEKLKETVDTFERIGTDKDFAPFRQARDQAQELYIRIEDIRGAMFELEESGGAFTNKFQLNNSGAEKLKNDIEAATVKLKELQSAKEQMESSGNSYTLGIDTEEYARAAEKVRELNESIEAGKWKLSELQAKQRPVTQELERMQKAAGSLGKIFGNAGKAAGKAFRGMKDSAHRLFSSMNTDADKAGRILSVLQTRLKGIALSLLIFNWISKGFNAMVSGMKEGFESLAKYSDGYTDSIQRLKNAQATLGNSFAAAFAPIIQTAIPYLVELINWVNTAVNALGQLFAALSGKSTWTKAVQVQSSYKDALNGTADAAKKAYGALAKFDDLDVLQTQDDKTENAGSGGGTGGVTGGFEEVPIENDIKKIADKVRDILSKLFEPFKEAWEREGQFVMDSWKYALDEVWRLLKDIGRDFLIVWNQEKTVQMFADILHIVGDIGLVIGNIAHGLDDAWNYCNTGLYILQNIRDIFAAIVKNIRSAADYTVEWSKTLDFKPLLTKVKELTKSLIPVARELSGAMTDFYEDVLLKFSKWTLEKGLPELLQVFIDFNNEVEWERLRRNLKTFWEHLEPFTETVAEGVILFIDRLADAFADFLNGPAFENILQFLEDFMDGVTAEEVADGIENMIKLLVGLKIAYAGLGAVMNSVGFLLDFADAMFVIKELFADSNIIFGIQAFAGGAASLGEALAVAFPRLSSFVGLMAAHPAFPITAAVIGATVAIFNMDDAIGGTFGSWVEAVDKAAASSQNLSDEINRQSQEVQEYVSGAGAQEIEQARLLAERYNELADKTNRTNAETLEMKSLAQELVGLIPGLRDNIDQQTGLLNVQGEALDALITKTETYYRLQAAQDKIVEAYKTQLDAMENVKGSTDRLEEAELQYNSALEKRDAALNSSNAAMDYASSQMDGFQNNVTVAKEKLEEQRATLENSLEAYNNASDTISFLRECMDGWSDDLANVDYAEFALNTSNTIDEIGGLWEKGAGGWVQIIGEKALEMQDEIQKGLTPDEDGIYTAADGTMLAYGNALDEGITAYVKPTLDEGLLGTLEASLADGYKISKDAGGNWTLGVSEGISENQSVIDRALAILGENTKSSTLEALDEHSPSAFTVEAGKNWVLGFNNGILENASSTLEAMTMWIEGMKSLFTAEMWTRVFDGILLAFQTKWGELTEWWAGTAIPEFLAANTEEMFSIDNWLLVFNNIPLALKQIWEELLTWWDSEALPLWWETSVSVWFSQEKWLDILDNVRKAFEVKWNEIARLLEEIMQKILESMEKKEERIETGWQKTMDAMREAALAAFGDIRNEADAAISAVLAKIAELSGALSSLSAQFSSMGNMSAAISAYNAYSTRAVSDEYAASAIDNVPHLASGSVIRGGNPFVALLGDQPAGQTNIEAPLDTIRQAVREELSGMDFGSRQMKVVLQVNGSELAYATLNDFLSEASRQGYGVDILGWQG